MDFVGKAKRINDYDIPRIGAIIGVGEDELHAFMDVEAAGSGFDSKSRPKMLFEPHRFYAELGPGPKRDEAVRQGLARPTWKVNGKVPKYPKDSYPILLRAMKIDPNAAIKASSWGLTQILGKWHKDIGYPTPLAMVEAFMADEANHLEATVKLLVQWKIDDDLRAHRWSVIAEAWNGPAYKTHGYHTKLAAAFKKWQGIRDTVWPPKDWVPPIEIKLPEEIEEKLPAEPAENVDVTLAPTPKPGETAVVVTPTGDTPIKDQSTKVSPTGWAAVGAFILSLIAGAVRYFGG